MLPILVFISFLLTSCGIWYDTSDYPGYLPLDDSNSPYVGLPRLVIETDAFRQVRDRDEKIKAKLQIYGEKEPLSDILYLTIKGRGNSSWKGMAKYSLKLEFLNKQEMFGMPPNKDWVLVSNYADRSFLKNVISYKLFKWLGAPYSPRCSFVEVYLNREYMGLYLLTETPKQGKNRVSIPQNGKNFLLEMDEKFHADDISIKIEGLLPITVHFPKDVNDTGIRFVEERMGGWIQYLKRHDFNDDNYFDKWIDIEAYLRFYWMQEFSKNHDGYGASTYLTLKENGLIEMGPLWDMDLTFGEPLEDPTLLGWSHNNHGWNYHIWKNEKFRYLAKKYWQNHHDNFIAVLDTLESYRSDMNRYTKNEFKRWPTLENDENWTFRERFSSYDEVLDSLKSWINQRIDWIDANL